MMPAEPLPSLFASDHETHPIGIFFNDWKIGVPVGVFSSILTDLPTAQETRVVLIGIQILIQGG